jgi:hypothetical protein
MSFGFTLLKITIFPKKIHNNAKIPPKIKVDSKIYKKSYLYLLPKFHELLIFIDKMNFEKQNNDSTHKCQTKRGTLVIWPIKTILFFLLSLSISIVS